MKPFLQAGRQTYAAFVTDCHGARGNRSLGTKDLGEALAICAELEFLERRMLIPADRSLAMISAMAYKLFYGVDKPAAMSGSPRSGVDRREAVKIAEKVSDLEAEVRELRAYKEKYEALSNSLEAQRFKAMEEAPTLADTREAYIEDVKHLSREGRTSRTWFDLFCEAMGEDTKLAAITAGQIDAFIQSRVVDSKDPQRERKTRAEVTRYFGWAVRTYKITSPVDQLSRLTSSDN